MSEALNQQEHVCPKCGNGREWVQCDALGCEDGEVNYFESDPLWYGCEEDAWETCDLCDGEGGWWICYRCAREKTA